MTGACLALGVFFAGAAAALGHAPFHLLPISLIGFAGLIWFVARQHEIKAAALACWLGGTAYFAVTLHWIVEPFLVDVARHGWMAPFALVFLAGGLALFWGLAGALAARLGGTARRRGAVLVVMLAAVEMVRGYVLSGFPWALPGYVWIESVSYCIGSDGTWFEAGLSVQPEDSSFETSLL